MAARSDSLDAVMEREFLRASFLDARGDHPGAIKGYHELLRRQPLNAALYFSTAKAFLSLGELDSARVYAERCAALSPSNRHALGLLADVSHAMGEPKRAVQLYGKLAHMDPGNTELLTWLAMEHLAAEQPAEALSVFQRVLSLDPGNETARSHVLLLQIRMQRYPEAIASLREMTKGGNGDERLRLTLGGLYLRTGDYADAASTFREAIDASPGFIPAWLALFEVSVRSKDMMSFRSDLLSFYDTLRPALPKKLELTRFYLSESVSDSLYRIPSRIMLDETCRRHPESAEALMLRGWARMRADDLGGALRDFRAAVPLDQKNSDLRESLVSALLVSRQFSAAQRVVLRARRDFPSERLRFQILEGYVLYESGKARQAVPLLEQALRSRRILERRELQERALSTLAFAYDTMGVPAKSMPLYEQLLVLEPGNALVLNNLAYSLTIVGSDLKRARQLAEAAVAKEPDSGVYLDTLGWILYRQGELKEARIRLERAMELEPLEPEIARHLAELYRAAGELEKSEAMQKKAEELELNRALPPTGS
ncbi:tetratricopeptide repeat protein [Pelodictyon luteolum]|nr:tetratricopeptide repeat protein [Pelodictyon luteolum]